MRPLHLLRVTTLIALFGTPVLAEAPPDQYGPFDRFDLEIRDVKTGLVWQREVGAAQSFQGAADQCSVFGGRLPTVKELLTLVDEAAELEYQNGVLVTKLIDHKYVFPLTASPVDLPYWTSTPADATDSGQVWTLSFADGAMAKTERTAVRRHRCVK